MTRYKGCHLGIMFRREHAPEALPDFARRVEAAGFDELWVVEDCFYGSGIASAATALACTNSISVGLGIMPAVVRNPVFAAMEIATLARLYPGRFLPGFGHGVTEWMRQIGAFPASQLKALEEVTLTVRALLRGEQVTFDGQHVHLDQTQLLYPPEQIPPISLGVIGPKSLAISGRVADGTILSEYTNPAYISWAREQIAGGESEKEHAGEHRITVFAFACAETTTAAARQKLRPMVADAVASGGIDAKLEAMGVLPQAREYRAAGDRRHLETAMPEEWLDRLTIAGTPQDWKRAINQLVDRGAHAVVLVPMPEADLNEVEKFARHLQEMATTA